MLEVIPEEDVCGSRETEDVRESVSLCSLTVGTRLFGIETSTILEVLAPRTIDRVPLAPRFIGGVFPYRGEVLTAVSLRSLLGLEAVEGKCNVLVLEGDAQEERFGLMADRVGGVVTVERRLFSPNPVTLDEASRAIFAGAYTTGEGLLVELDAERLRPARLAATGLFRTARQMSLQGKYAVPTAEGEIQCEL